MSNDTQYENKRKWYLNNAAYVKAQSKLRKQEMREFVLKYKEKPCTMCGVSYPYFVMDLHHREPDKKEAAIAKLVRDGVSWQRLITELNKCDVVCANCHRIITHGEL